MTTGDLDRSNLVTIAILGILAGSASLIAFSTAGLLEPDATPAQQLQAYLAKPAVFEEYGWAFAFFGLLGIPFVVALGVLVRQRNLVIASFSTVLAAAGIFLLAFATNFWVGTLASIDAASGSAPTIADATYQAAVASSILAYPTIFGFILFGWGFFFLSWLALKGRILPKWLGIIGLVAGLADGIPIGPIPELLGNFAFAIFGFATSVLLIRRLHLRSMPTGIVLVVIGILLFISPFANLPFSPVIGNTPIALFFIVAGAYLIWSGWRARAGSGTQALSDERV